MTLPSPDPRFATRLLRRRLLLYVAFLLLAIVLAILFRTPGHPPAPQGALSPSTIGDRHA